MKKIENKSPLVKALEIIKEIAEPDKIILFGSQAKGTALPSSDYDLLILKKGLKEKRPLLQNLYLNMKNIGAGIDLIIEDSEKFELLKNDPYLIYMEADLNGIIVYAR